MLICESVSFRDLNEKLYRDFLDKNSQDIFYVTYEWLKCLNCFPNMEVACIMVRDEMGIIGIMPYVIRKKYGVMIYESMPYSLYGGFQINTDCAAKILDYICNIARCYSSLYLLRINFGNNISHNLIRDVRNFGFEVIKASAAIVPLHRTSDDLFRSYKHNVRKNINKAIREDVVISEIRDENELYEFYKMAKYIYEYHNSKMPYTYELYKKIFDYLVPTGAARYTVAKRHDVIMAGGIHFYDCHKKEVLNWLTPSYREYQQYRANTLLISEAIKDASERGFDWYNLGASPAGEKGLLQFKHNWGAIDRKYLLCYKQCKVLRMYSGLRKALRK